MKVLDIFETAVSGYDPTDDRLNSKQLDDTRKPILTLRHLNKLRKMREFKKLEMKERKDFWKVIYGKDQAVDEVPQF